jgi:hypothetical protein
VNEVPVSIHMKLDDNGAAYFVESVDSDDDDEDIPPSENQALCLKALNH